MVYLIIMEIILIGFVIFLASQFYNIIFRGFAPFISTKTKVIQKILAELRLKPDAVVYELGCGKAGFLRALAKKFPQARLIGIEYSLLPFLIARCQTILSKSRITIRRLNLFKVNLSEVDLIYCYLNRLMMRRLEEKFKSECRPGTQIISYAFALPNLKPDQVIAAGGAKIYFYTI